MSQLLPRVAATRIDRVTILHPQDLGDNLRILETGTGTASASVIATGILVENEIQGLQWVLEAEIWLAGSARHRHMQAAAAVIEIVNVNVTDLAMLIFPLEGCANPHPLHLAREATAITLPMVAAVGLSRGI